MHHGGTEDTEKEVTGGKQVESVLGGFDSVLRVLSVFVVHSASSLSAWLSLKNPTRMNTDAPRPIRPAPPPRSARRAGPQAGSGKNMARNFIRVYPWNIFRIPRVAAFE